MENLNQEVGIVIAGRIAPYLSGVLPKDFPKRLERLWEASGLTWNAFADALGVDKKRVHRWRPKKNGKKPVKPDGDGYHALVKLAALIPGGLDILMGDGFQMYLWQDWQDWQDRHDQQD